jgi:hypothetical protein
MIFVPSCKSASSFHVWPTDAHASKAAPSSKAAEIDLNTLDTKLLVIMFGPSFRFTSLAVDIARHRSQKARSAGN